MSSGARGGRTRSRWPRRTARSSAALSTSSSRVVGKRRPFGIAPREWPERPTRWSSVAMLRGEPSWQTSSTGPMSMPSSSEAVATSTRRSPARRRSSTRSRRSFERLPWWAATCPSPSLSSSRCATRSASRRVFEKTSVVRCLLDLARDLVEQLAPLLAGRDRLQLAGRHDDLEIERAAVADVDDRAGRPALRVRAAGPFSDQQARDRLDRALGGGEADARRPLRAERVEPREREREVRAALVARHRVDLVDDHACARGAASPGCARR